MIEIDYIRELIASLLDVETEEVEADAKIFIDLEMDSMTFMELVYQLEKKLNIKLERPIIKYDLTVKDIVETLNEIMEENIVISDGTGRTD